MRVTISPPCAGSFALLNNRQTRGHCSRYAPQRLIRPSTRVFGCSSPRYLGGQHSEGAVTRLGPREIAQGQRERGWRKAGRNLETNTQHKEEPPKYQLTPLVMSANLTRCMFSDHCFTSFAVLDSTQSLSHAEELQVQEGCQRPERRKRQTSRTTTRLPKYDPNTASTVC